ncbi:MORN repeat-containing protein 1-like isoform X3 [Ostrea edulis]|uniref:MORN repeat-containing protein 1-like isoform X3 n=1 Tax=Ostrea edulis TaxID=37623 RepID=UPI0024AFAF07|nr:MORN repeat-containing protein 1-like isoform X3 [Ostrea edulis]
MPTITATRYTDYKKKFNRQIKNQKGSTSSTDSSSDHGKVFLAFDKTESLENFKLPHLKPSSTFPVKPRQQISERKEYCVNPFPKRGSGHGIYQFENRYFRYEGEWRNGVKHGHGKLQMADGSFYEGTFTNGEIDGSGTRFFSQTGNKYMGQFSMGELHGRGIMTYIDGSVYEGEWYKNRKHGYGVMRTNKTEADEIYEGGYDGNMKHGVGVMKYANGDRYEGMWVNDVRDGRGILYCNDGSVYEGDFKSDYFNGRGRMHHISGLIYDGLWINGYPEIMASKLKITFNNNYEKDKKKKPPKDSNKVTIYQGIGFDVSVECYNESDRLIQDQGREVRLLAGFKYYPPVSRGDQEDALFDMIEDDAEEQPIQTPFGYSVVPYPITDQINVNIDDIPDDDEQDDPDKSPAENSQAPGAESGDEDVEKQENENKENEKEVTTEENPEEKDEEDKGNESDNDETPDLESTVPQFPPLTSLRTKDGLCQWDDLHLTPAPPKYRPFERMEAEERSKLQSKSRSRSKELFTPSMSRQPSIFDKFRAKKQKALEEKFAKLGEYVLIVEDVTNPPFMGRRLEPDFLLMKLKQPPKEFKRESKKWDTSAHIKGSMRAKEDELLVKKHFKV